MQYQSAGIVILFVAAIGAIVRLAYLAARARREARGQRELLALALDSLSASLRLRRLPDGLVRVSGRLAADVVQSCVVTLAPVASHCAAEFSMRFGAGAMPETVREIEVDSVGEDDPEPIVDGHIDLGEAVVQQLAVSLDPYPRAPGAALPAGLADHAAGDDEAAGENPFAALERLRGGDGGER